MKDGWISHSHHDSGEGTTVAFHVLEHAAGLGELFATARAGKLFLPGMNDGVSLKGRRMDKVSGTIQTRKAPLPPACLKK